MTYRIEQIAKNKDVNIKVLRYIDIDISHVDLTIFNSSELEEFNQFKSTKRQLEYYYARVLWSTFNQNELILYKTSGKPILKDNFISISHSHQQVAVAFSSTKEIGMDLEQQSEKVRKVKTKYLHPSENYSGVNKLTKVWTIKEAIYKLYDSDQISFKRDIIIENISTQPDVKVNYLNEILEPSVQTIELNNNFILSFVQ